MELYEKLAEELKPAVEAYIRERLKFTNAMIDSSTSPDPAAGYHYPPTDQSDMTFLLCALAGLTSATDFEPHSDDTGIAIDFNDSWDQTFSVFVDQIKVPSTD